MASKVIGFAGYSGNGKTTLIAGLLPLLSARGLRVSVLKHAHHGVDADESGKDSDRLRRAGAREVLLAAGAPAGPASLQRWLDAMADCDLVLVEGFKRAHIRKIEVRRMAAGTAPLYPDDPWIVAVATDGAVDAALPVFALDDYAGIAGFLLAGDGRTGCKGGAKRG